jgi:hypothetical protein
MISSFDAQMTGKKNGSKGKANKGKEKAGEPYKALRDDSDRKVGDLVPQSEGLQGI